MQNYHLHLKGFVGGYDFDKNYVDYVLSKNAGKPVFVLIDSLGGSLATALSIASSFRNHGDVTVHFVGMNASAATIASLGAKHITMDASAMYLAHKCSTEFFQWAQLNADQLADQIASLEQLKTDLEKMDANVAGMYSRKCKKDADALLALMKVGGWLSAKESMRLPTPMRTKPRYSPMPLLPLWLQSACLSPICRSRAIRNSPSFSMPSLICSVRKTNNPKIFLNL